MRDEAIDRDLRVAIVHYWFIEPRGGEKVVEALCELFPQADLFTNIADRTVFPDLFARHKLTTTFIDRLPAAKTQVCCYLPLMPFALEQLDFSGYDLVITSESGPAKYVSVPENCIHVCYCHSPMRYIWNMYHEYRRQLPAIAKLLMSVAAHYLRIVDVASAKRVDSFVVNSRAVAGRVSKYYGRDSEVIPPPVEVDEFRAKRSEPGDYFLYCGQLTGYKRADIAIDCFNDTGERLVIIGTGDMQRKLKRSSKKNIEFLGWLPDREMRQYMACCRALVFPGEEDFGIVPVEVMAAGRPVVAFAKGGALDTVIDGETGVLFAEQSVAGLREALLRFKRMESVFEPEAIRAHAALFRKSIFKEKFAAHVRLILDRRHSVEPRKNGVSSLASKG